MSLSTFGPPPMRLRRIKKHLQAIAADDVLIAREGAGERLSVEELREALEERGMYVPLLTVESSFADNLVFQLVVSQRACRRMPCVRDSVGGFRRRARRAMRTRFGRACCSSRATRLASTTRRRYGRQVRLLDGRGWTTRCLRDDRARRRYLLRIIVNGGLIAVYSFTAQLQSTYTHHTPSLHTLIATVLPLNTSHMQNLYSRKRIFTLIATYSR